MSPSSSGNLQEVWRYYDRTESRTGYKVLLGGTKHFGWYEEGESKWRFNDSMRRMEDELATRLDLEQDAVVLDAGCGIGDVSRALAARHGLRVEGIDILDFNLEEAIIRSERTGLSGRTRFQWGDYHEIPFPDSTFDGVFTMETLVHSPDPTKVLREFFRVLKPGGKLALFEYSRVRDDEMHTAAQEALKDVCRIAAMPGWLLFVDDALPQLVQSIGFDDVFDEDITARMLPMLEAFARVGRLPYWVGRRIGRVEKTINAMSAVEMARHEDVWQYNILTATKPLGAV